MSSIYKKTFKTTLSNIIYSILNIYLISNLLRKVEEIFVLYLYLYLYFIYIIYIGYIGYIVYISFIYQVLKVINVFILNKTLYIDKYRILYTK